MKLNVMDTSIERAIMERNANAIGRVIRRAVGRRGGNLMRVTYVRDSKHVDLFPHCLIRVPLGRHSWYSGG